MNLENASSVSKTLHVGRPNILNAHAVQSRLSQVLDRCWLTNDGPLVQEFEQRIAELTGARHCIAMCNATIALEIVVRAAELTGEVIVPAYTFVATAHALQWQQITPVLCDIDPDTHNLDPASVERLISPRTTAILGVHLWGRACNVEALEAIARKHNLKVMFDAAHAFTCTHRRRAIGNFGLAEVFSFHATKFINCAEGGAVVTNDDAFAEKLRLMRNFGFAGYDNVVSIGTNGKMSELSAAMGLTSLDSLEGILAINRRNFEAYRDAVAALPGIALLTYPTEEQNNYQYIVLLIDPLTCPLTRDQIVQVLHANRVLARRYFYPGVHRMEPYRSQPGASDRVLPVTDDIAARVVVMPTGSAVSPDDILRIAAILRWAFENAVEMSAALPRSVPPGHPFDARLP